MRQALVRLGPIEGAEEQRQLCLMRLERLLSGVWKVAEGDLLSVDRAIRLTLEIAKLEGVEPPKVYWFDLIEEERQLARETGVGEERTVKEAEKILDELGYRDRRGLRRLEPGPSSEAHLSEPLCGNQSWRRRHQLSRRARCASRRVRTCGERCRDRFQSLVADPTQLPDGKDKRAARGGSDGRPDFKVRRAGGRIGDGGTVRAIRTSAG